MLVNTLTSTAGGVVQIADINQSIPALLQTPGAVIPDGTYVYSAVVTDMAGNASPPGPSSPVITIDTAILVAPPPTVAPSSDSGLPVASRDSDAITNIALPTFQGTVGPNAVVTLCGRGREPQGGGDHDRQRGGALRDHHHGAAGVGAEQRRRSSRPTRRGTSLCRRRPWSVRLDTVTPPSITPTLAPFSDTGTFSNDTLTDTTTPTFTGNATPWQFLSANPTPQNDGTLVQIYLQLVTPTPTPPPAARRRTPLLENPVFLAGEALANPATGRVLRDGRPVRQPAARGGRGRDGHGDSRHRPAAAR